MRKKTLIGSMLVLTLLLLMPSIPAIQTNVIKEDIKQDIQEKLDDYISEISSNHQNIKNLNLFKSIFKILIPLAVAVIVIYMIFIIVIMILAILRGWFPPI